jgi:tripartite-type tricarboxylate transporter receptor subunit TctC
MHLLRFRPALFFCLVALIASAHAQVASFPSRPIRVINPHGAGGSTDLMIRIVGDRLAQQWGQPVVVENKPGANAMIGTELAAKAVPDGYTWSMCTQATHGSNPAVYAKLRYDPLGDFVPVVPLAEVALFVIVKPESPYRNFADVLAAAKANPAKLTYGSIGVGSLQHLAGEALRVRSGADILHVPFKTTGDMTTALLGGSIDMAFHSTPLPLMRSGQVRALAVSTRVRWPSAPEVPTIQEQGVRDFEARGWFAVCTRRGTPQPILEKINRDINAILKEPATAQKMSDTGTRPMGGSLAETMDLVQRELAHWREVSRAAGLKLDSQ